MFSSSNKTPLTQSSIKSQNRPLPTEPGADAGGGLLLLRRERAEVCAHCAHAVGKARAELLLRGRVGRLHAAQPVQLAVQPRDVTRRRIRRAQQLKGRMAYAQSNRLAHQTGWSIKRASPSNGLIHQTGWPIKRAGPSNGLAHQMG